MRYFDDLEVIKLFMALIRQAKRFRQTLGSGSSNFPANGGQYDSSLVFRQGTGSSSWHFWCSTIWKTGCHKVDSITT